MKYGKIRIEDGNFIFSRHMLINYLPCKDILWAYKRKEGAEGGVQKQYSTSSLVIITRRKKKYQFEMTDREIHSCIQLLKALHPEIATGYPQGGRIPLQSLPNTRDLGALETVDGKHILPKRLLRSGDLYHLSIMDQDMLKKEYRLSAVIDFRTRMESLKKPDTVMEGVTWFEMPIVDEETLGITREAGFMEMLNRVKASPDEFMLRQYASLVHDDYSVKQYARFLDVLLHQEEGAVLWHCSAGKDRVGVGTALLLHALGVPKKTIYEDFMRTNLCLEGEMEHMIRLLETKMIVDNEVMDVVRLLYRVKEEYLDTVFETIEKDYGSMDVFMKKALYMSSKNLEDLRKKYLV
ncbi:tyrosine-protein phosphatase [Blautia sp. MSJ-19]|uniref:tyrosine-protein phosphatase n=1 Tax=Blautia sp. MSJ-19 TaxID=2841517 RepID=UPI001C0F0B75|nr:tyrosine-protein phosphatase [Blautia sp. MSJ-19]MBU5482300.1 tyrosine-protein phosphatase [Blautia sp. MSJ-19]